MEMRTTAPHGLKTGQYVSFDPSFGLTSAAISGTTVTYTGTILAGRQNGLASATVIISGFSNSGNNGTFTVTSSTATTIVLTNASGVNESHSATGTTGYPTIPLSASGSVTFTATPAFLFCAALRHSAQIHS